MYCFTETIASRFSLAFAVVLLHIRGERGEWGIRGVRKNRMADTMIFDTHKYVRKLTHGGGLSEGQAGAHVEALQDAMRDGVASKTDLFAVRHEMEILRVEMESFRKEMRNEMQTFRKEMRNEMQAFRKEMHNEMQTFRNEMQTFRNEMQTFRDSLQLQRQFMLLGFSLIGTMIIVATFLDKIL